MTYLITVFLAWFSWDSVMFATPAVPQVVHGTLDLSQWNGQDVIDLTGVWFSAEDQLLDGSTAMNAAPETWTPIPVPTPAEFPGQIKNGRQQRTYMLRITGMRPEHELGLYLLWVGTSGKFIFYEPQTGRQEILLRLGKVHPENNQRIPIYTANTFAKIPQGAGEALLLVQVSRRMFNEERMFPYGLFQKVVLGPATKLDSQARQHFYLTFLVIGLYLLVAIFNLALFIQQPTEKGNLYLFFFALSLAWRYLGTEGVVAQLQTTPTLDGFYFTISALAYGPAMACFTLALFLRSTFPKHVPRIFVPLNGALLLYMLGTTWAVSITFTQAQWVPQTLVMMVLFLAYCWCIFRATKAREEGAILGLVGFGGVFVFHLNDFLVAIEVIQFVYLGHYSLVFLIFMQSLIVGRRFALAFERTRIMSEELKVKNMALEDQQKEIKGLNQSLQEYADNLEQKVEEKTRDIVSILNNIRHGILAVRSPSGELAPEHSHFLRTMFNITRTEGHNIADICLRDSSLTQDQIDQTRTALAMMVGEDALAFDLNLDALPKQLSRSDDKGQHFYELDWSPVVAGNQIEKILLVIRDVTEIKRLRLAAENQASELSLIADIINIPKERFESLIAATERLLNANRELLLHAKQLDHSLADRLYRNLHTVKGITRTYQLRQVTDLVHTAEGRYKLWKSGEGFEPTILLQDIDQIAEVLNRMLQINRQKLGRSTIQDSRYILIDKVQFEDNLRNIRDIDIQALQSADKSRFERIKLLFYKVAYTPLQKVLEAQIDSLTHLAQSLHKLPPKAKFFDPGFSLNREVHEPLNNVFNHLFRNSMDHGIETPDERQAKGKPLAGTLSFHLSTFLGQLRIEFSDDGAGLNLAKIRQKAIQKGCLTPDQVYNHLLLAQLILQPDFSTSDRLSDISGRGVGMDAVRSFVEDMNGTFDIEIDDPLSQELRTIPVRFVIILPATQFQQIDIPLSAEESMSGLKAVV